MRLWAKGLKTSKAQGLSQGRTSMRNVEEMRKPIRNLRPERVNEKRRCLPKGEWFLCYPNGALE